MVVCFQKEPIACLSVFILEKYKYVIPVQLVTNELLCLALPGQPREKLFDHILILSFIRSSPFLHQNIISQAAETRANIF